MSRNDETGRTGWVDPDDAPPFTAQMFTRAELRDGDRVIRRRRSPLPFPKVQISVRLDPDILERLRAMGPGWQARMNEMLRVGLENEK